MDKVFQALASTPRRKILAYLAEAELTAGEIAGRVDRSDTNPRHFGLQYR